MVGWVVHYTSHWSAFCTAEDDTFRQSTALHSVLYTPRLLSSYEAYRAHIEDIEDIPGRVDIEETPAYQKHPTTGI